MTKEVTEEQGWSIRRCAAKFGVYHSNLIKWLRNEEIILEKMSKKSVHSGPSGQLEDSKESILKWIFEHRETGLAVSHLSVVFYAGIVNPEFAGKSPEAKLSAVCHFLQNNTLVYCMGTHESQKPPEETRLESLDFLSVICPELVGPARHKKFILSMDQMPVYFSMHIGHILEGAGAKSVNICTCDGEGVRVTVAVTITANGDVLEPYIIFKGEMHVKKFTE